MNPGQGSRFSNLNFRLLRAHQTVSARSFTSYWNLLQGLWLYLQGIQRLQFNFLWIGGHSATSSHGLAHLEDNAIFADCSFSLMGVYVTSCLKRMPSAPQWRSWSTSWVFKMALPSTTKANTRLQRELPQDLILMDLTSLCSEYKIQSLTKHIFFSMYAIKKLNNLELKLYVAKHSPSHRPDHRKNMNVNNHLLDILFKEILLSCWGQSKIRT